MKPWTKRTDAANRSLIGFAVTDHSGQPVGTVCSLWTHPQTGDVQFFAVEATGRSGGGLVVPAQGARVNETRRLVRVPYPAAWIRDAPTPAPGVLFTPEGEREIYLHFEVKATYYPRRSRVVPKEGPFAAPVSA
jgi:PRC-barrel domain